VRASEVRYACNCVQPAWLLNYTVEEHCRPFAAQPACSSRHVGVFGRPLPRTRNSLSACSLNRRV